MNHAGRQTSLNKILHSSCSHQLLYLNRWKEEKVPSDPAALDSQMRNRYFLCSKSNAQIRVAETETADLDDREIICYWITIKGRVKKREYRCKLKDSIGSYTRFKYHIKFKSTYKMSPSIDRDHPLICSGFIFNISPSLSQLSYTIVGNTLPGRIFLFLFLAFFFFSPRSRVVLFSYRTRSWCADPVSLLSFLPEFTGRCYTYSLVVSPMISTTSCESHTRPGERGGEEKRGEGGEEVWLGAHLRTSPSSWPPRTRH